MKKIYHLKTCSTCQRILKEVNAKGDFKLQDIKTEAISEAQLEEMKKQYQEIRGGESKVEQLELK